MSVIDISKGYRTYTPEELRNAAYSGIIYCGDKDLTDFLEYIFIGYKSPVEDGEIQKYESSSYDSGYADGYAEAKSAAMNAVEDI